MNLRDGDPLCHIGFRLGVQVAELMPCMEENKNLSYCKVVEVIAETTTPLLPMEELLAKIKSDRQEKQKNRVKQEDVRQVETSSSTSLIF
ncbi:protein TIC 62, chloroplastic-like isoform X2 [Zingiber officinale]|uniref:protein TIC 62, chloroplastic-like isoform X2 n=1 Tax=Zingiber officinale TaxID=94328 RepID=UPI001C4BFAF2|nr:protein TIC 62, chloroplastic-like isoform X2 [Zingiber officinale]